MLKVKICWLRDLSAKDLVQALWEPFNGRLSGTTRVSRYQKGETDLDFTEARDSEWQWHQLGHMQACTSLQTDNHASTPPLRFYWPDALPIASKHWRHRVGMISNQEKSFIQNNVIRDVRLGQRRLEHRRSSTFNSSSRETDDARQAISSYTLGEHWHYASAWWLAEPCMLARRRHHTEY